jgi:hypothetical protein
MKKLILILICLMIPAISLAEFCWVICQPDSFVNVRRFARKGADIAGRVELGDELETDGKKRNGFIHVIGFEGDGWIHSGFVTFSPVTVLTCNAQIDAPGRVACRRAINGTRRKWLIDGQNLTVFAWADDWAITNQGFVQTRYLNGF